MSVVLSNNRDFFISTKVYLCYTTTKLIVKLIILSFLVMLSYAMKSSLHLCFSTLSISIKVYLCYTTTKRIAKINNIIFFSYVELCYQKLSAFVFFNIIH